jgi:hypothetical protein
MIREPQILLGNTPAGCAIVESVLVEAQSEMIGHLTIHAIPHRPDFIALVGI